MPVLQYIVLRESIGATTISEFQNLLQVCGRWLLINYSLLHDTISAPWRVGVPDIFVFQISFFLY